MPTIPRMSMLEPTRSGSICRVNIPDQNALDTPEYISSGVKYSTPSTEPQIRTTRSSGFDSPISGRGPCGPVAGGDWYSVSAAVPRKHSPAQPRNSGESLGDHPGTRVSSTVRPHGRGPPVEELPLFCCCFG